MSIEEELGRLRTENEALRQQVQDLLEVTADLEAALKKAQGEKGKKRAPGWVKANRPKRPSERPTRRKREAGSNGVRRCEEATRVVEHRLERCPDCGGRLHRKKAGHRHQVVDIPPPAPVAVTEHRVIKGWCAHCATWKGPRLDLCGEVLGQGRIGLRLTSLIVCLRTELRLPVRQIQAYLQAQHQVAVSVGELVELLHRVRRASAAELDRLRQAMQASPVVHGDETGWREAGQNGYVWSASVPGAQGLRWYTYQHSRSRWVVKGILGNDFHGVLESDFLGSYNIYAGPHQRCWVHLLRDLHALKENHPDQGAVGAWADAVRALREQALAFTRQTAPPNAAERQACYATLVGRLEQLGQRYARCRKHPCQALAQRLLRHLEEMFQFVLHPGISDNNNEAERSLRPLVIARKISGGTRSPAGSATRMALQTLVATWLVRGQNPLHQCFQLLSQIPLPQP